MPYEKPLLRTREYLEIIRRILAREEPLHYEGHHYRLPQTGPGSTGSGKPLKSVAHPNSDQPIFLASISPGGLRLAAEISEGVILSFLDPEDTREVVDRHLEEGFAKDGARCDRSTFIVSTMVQVIVHDDVAEVHRMMKPAMARQLGGMGSKRKNFYAEFAKRMGYEEEVEQIQSLYLAGEKEKAAEAVPEALFDRTSLIGPPERIRDRLACWKAAEQRGALDLMIVTSSQPAALKLMAEEML